MPGIMDMEDLISEVVIKDVKGRLSELEFMRGPIIGKENEFMNIYLEKDTKKFIMKKFKNPDEKT